MNLFFFRKLQIKKRVLSYVEMNEPVHNFIILIFVIIIAYENKRMIEKRQDKHNGKLEKNNTYYLNLIFPSKFIFLRQNETVSKVLIIFLSFCINYFEKYESTLIIALK